MSVLQCVESEKSIGARTTVVAGVAVCCSMLQRVLVCLSVLQCVESKKCFGARNSVIAGVQCVAVCFSVVHCVAVYCSVLQCVAVCCSVLQCVAVCCSLNKKKRTRARTTIHESQMVSVECI